MNYGQGAKHTDNDSIHHGTKFALEWVSECIRYELGSFGIKGILIEPGSVGSNF